MLNPRKGWCTYEFFLPLTSRQCKTGKWAVTMFGWHCVLVCLRELGPVLPSPKYQGCQGLKCPFLSLQGTFLHFDIFPGIAVSVPPQNIACQLFLCCGHLQESGHASHPVFAIVHLSLGNLNFHIMQLFATFGRCCVKRNPLWPVHTIFAWIIYIFWRNITTLKVHVWNWKHLSLASIFEEYTCGLVLKPRCTGCWTLFKEEYHQISTKIALVSEFKFPNERRFATVSEWISDDTDRSGGVKYWSNA